MSDNLPQANSVPAWGVALAGRCPVSGGRCGNNETRTGPLEGSRPEEHLGHGGKFYKWEMNCRKSGTNLAAWSLTNSISVIPAQALAQARCMQPDHIQLLY
jgi:hypothetical protein